jgi:hypothetical protein
LSAAQQAALIALPPHQQDSRHKARTEASWATLLRLDQRHPPPYRKGGFNRSKS